MTENVLDQARSLFFAEAREMCEQIEASLLKLEEDPTRSRNPETPCSAPPTPSRARPACSA